MLCTRTASKEDILERQLPQPLGRSACKATLGAECSLFMHTSPVQPGQSLIHDEKVSCRGERAVPKVAASVVNTL